MTNREIARILDKIADMLELKDENQFRVRAYRQAAHAVYHLDEDLRDLYRQGTLKEIAGIGNAIQAKIEEMLETGKCLYYERLKEEVPQGLLDILALPGIGHKTVRAIYEQLGIITLEDLALAAKKNLIRKLPGMGAKTEYNILKGIELLNKSREKVTLGLAMPLAYEFSRHILQGNGVRHATPVGSVRRGKPLVGDIDILVAAEDFSRVPSQVASYRYTREITSSGDNFVQGYLEYNIKFEVIIVAPKDYFGRLVWTTGSKEYREAVFQGIEMESLPEFKSEFEVFDYLKMQYTPPELRENRGEIEKARQYKLPNLVDYKDIKGELHVHTDWSDGANSLEDMVNQARKLGYSYLAITDHSRSLHISGGLSEERLQQQSEAIDDFNSRVNDFKILKGSEVDILKDGCLDYNDKNLSQLDLVIASIHSHFNLSAELQTARIIKAIENPHVHIIGHLTGRLLNRRPPYAIDIDKILAAAAVHGTILEINSHPDRLDIDEDIARKAAGLGIKIAVNSDAHDKKDMELVQYGVLTARRGWLSKIDIINTWELDQVMEYLAQKKG